jgi:hypothetical protein
LALHEIRTVDAGRGDAQQYFVRAWHRVFDLGPLEHVRVSWLGDDDRVHSCLLVREPLWEGSVNWVVGSSGLYDELTACANSMASALTLMRPREDEGDDP